MARVFISYSHADETWKDKVVRQLQVLSDEGVTVWQDRKIGAGDDWLAQIEQAMADCRVALLLISDHFLTSDFIKRQEVPPLLQRREEEGVRVIPVIVSPCQWTKKTWLKSIQARPTDGKPLTGMSTHDAAQALSDLAGEIHDLLTAADNHAARPPSPSGRGAGREGVGRSPKIDRSHFPAGAPHFLGRETELAALDAAWAETGQTAIVQLIAPGGTGKTALVARWVDKLKAQHWSGADKIFAWSFYSQGSGDDRQASDDGFFAAALDFFGVNIAPTASPWDKGAALADAVARARSLLILDGLEPLQYPPTATALAGELKAPGVQTLLRQLASHGQPGLTLITSREHLADLAEWVKNDDRPEANVLVLDLGNLSDSDGARLLHRLGVTQAGAATIAADDQELQAASREVAGHALTLSLLGSYLARAKGGDVRRLAEVDFAKANERTNKGHAFHVIQTYATWFQREGAAGARELAALRLLGFFDRPASRDNLAALIAPPAIAGLTEALVGLDQDDWQLTLSNLQSAGLAKFDAASASLDAHPLVREYLADALRKQQPDAFREGHRRIYEQLKSSTPHRPEGLAGLQPLYQAVAHGCLAGRWQEACDEVYWDRILRGTGQDGFYSLRKLGAFGADLGAVACFFSSPWRQPAAALKESDQAWLLNEAAILLRALGRLDEALEPLRAGAEMGAHAEDWNEAAIRYGNLSELQLSLGRVAAAAADARSSVDYADRRGDWSMRMGMRTTLADALHQHADSGAAALFVEAEALQAERQPDYPLLYSLQGFRYCDWLLAPAERAAWAAWLAADAGLAPGSAADVGLKPEPPACRGELVRPTLTARANQSAPTEDLAAALPASGEVAKRAAQTLNWAEENNLSLLTKALDHLTLARCALYADLLQGRPPGTEAQTHTEQAVAGLRAFGHQEFIVRALLTRAWLRAALGDAAAARADLDEVARIAGRGNMKLFLADLHLTRARLFPHDNAREELAQARKLIQECEYHRRLPELAAAAAAILADAGDQR